MERLKGLSKKVGPLGTVSCGLPSCGFHGFFVVDDVLTRGFLELLTDSSPSASARGVPMLRLNSFGTVTRVERS
jgi:hypothetical protein